MKKLLLLILSFSIKAQDVKIGTQTWTSKNLDVETYRNGDNIPEAEMNNGWFFLKTGAYCYYNEITDNGIMYGKLYNRYAVNDPRGLAPKGYHVPTDAEWTKLTDYLGGNSIFEQAGTKMKSTNNWGLGNGTNTSGFAGLPGGVAGNGDFYYIREKGFWWSSSEKNTTADKSLTYKAKSVEALAWTCELYAISGNVKRNFTGKYNGLSVRCIKD